MKKSIALAVGLVLAVTLAQPARAHESDGCVAYAGERCSYVAAHSGGIVAAGDMWKVKIKRRGRTIEYGPSVYLDAHSYAMKMKNAIRKGDRVYVTTGDTIRHAISFADWPPVVVDYVAVGSDYNS